MARVIASGSALLELHVVGETGTLSYGGVCGGGVPRPNVDEKMKRGFAWDRGHGQVIKCQWEKKGDLLILSTIKI